MVIRAQLLIIVNLLYSPYRALGLTIVNHHPFFYVVHHVVVNVHDNNNECRRKEEEEMN